MRHALCILCCSAIFGLMSPLALAVETEADTLASSDASHSFAPRDTLSRFSLQMQITPLATSMLPEQTMAEAPPSYSFRGAFEFNHSWQGYVEWGNQFYLITDSAAIWMQDANSQKTDHLGGGVRYAFPSGVYLEGGLKFSETSSSQDSVDVQPLVSFGYQF